MRRLLLALVISVLSTVPAVAQTAEPVPCDPPPAGATVVGPNHSSTITVPSPARLPSRGTTDRQFQLDLSPATATNKATLSSTLSWQIAANDWDLILLDANGEELAISEGFQPLDPPGEALSAPLLHCSVFTLRVLNFNAVQADAIDPLRLTITTGSVS